MIQKTDSNITQDPLDSLIERTLARDAESTRERFAVVPNAQLTVKLALTTASRGLLSSLSAKFALYTGAAIIVGGALYLWPKNKEPHLRITTPAPAISHSQPVSKPAIQASNKIETNAVAPPHPSKANTEPVPHSLTPSQKPHAIQLDEGTGKNIPTITDPHYRP